MEVFRTGRRTCGARLAAVACVALAAGLLAQPARAQQYGEADVRAAFVFNIAKFTEWPVDALPADATLRLCALEPSEAASTAMASLDGKKIASRVVQYRTLVRGAPVKGCQIVVLAPRAGPDAVRAVSLPGVMVIGEGEDVVDQGGMLGMYTANNRLQFDANAEAIRRSGVKLSSQVFRLANRVRDR